MRFRKKPVVVEAFQWLGGLHPDVKWSEAPPSNHQPYVHDVLHNSHISIRPGDWIITGVKGEKYPCSAEVFAATYESAE